MIIVSHCHNCIFARNCKNYKTDICAYKDKEEYGDVPDDVEFKYCKVECHECKYEDDCIPSCKGQNCEECRFFGNICVGAKEAWGEVEQ